jgi:hypothetical protein
MQFTNLTAHNEPADDTTPEQIEAPRVTPPLPPEFDQCCYPFGEPRTPGFHYCAAPVAQPGAARSISASAICTGTSRHEGGITASLLPSRGTVRRLVDFGAPFALPAGRGPAIVNIAAQWLTRRAGARQVERKAQDPDAGERVRLPIARAPTRSASAADAAHHDRLRGAQRDCMLAVRLRLVNNESQQLALLRARLEVMCETIAQLRMECSCRPSEPGAARQHEAVAARGTCTASMLRMHQKA